MSRERPRTVPLPLGALEAELPESRSWEFAVEDYGTDTTHVADIPGLDADTRYGHLLYDCGGERVVLGHNRARSFRTPAVEHERRRFQFALFSCHIPYAVKGLFRKRTEVANVDMWDFLGTTLERHGAEVDLVLAGGDQCYSGGVATLDIWRHLNRTRCREDGELLPGEEAVLSWYRDIHRGYVRAGGRGRQPHLPAHFERGHLQHLARAVVGAARRDRRGRMCDGYAFRRLALYTGGSYALVSVDPGAGESWFKLYGRQSLAVPPGVDDTNDAAVTHSLARMIRLS